jgi:hypothetical protein
MGFGAFLIFCLVVVAFAWLATWIVGYFFANAPGIIVKIIWGVAVLIIIVQLASAVGLLGHDIRIPHL